MIFPSRCFLSVRFWKRIELWIGPTWRLFLALTGESVYRSTMRDTSTVLLPATNPSTRASTPRKSRCRRGGWERRALTEWTCLSEVTTRASCLRCNARSLRQPEVTRCSLTWSVVRMTSWRTCWRRRENRTYFALVTTTTRVSDVTISK